MKKRIIHDALIILPVLLIGLGYFVFVSTTGHGLPCFIKCITGLDCPTCGSTRMMVALLHGNIRQAFEYNCVMFIALPISAIDLVLEEIKHIKTGKRLFSKFSFILYSVIIVALIIFFFVRNFG